MSTTRTRTETPAPIETDRADQAPSAPPAPSTPPTPATAPDLDTPPDLDPRGLDLTTDELDQARELLAAWWDGQTDERRKRFRARIEKRQKCRDLVNPRVRALAARYAVVSASMRQQLAAQAVGLDLRRDWGRIYTALTVDPCIEAIYHQARKSSGGRIAAKAEDVAERAMDGERVTQAQERLASMALERLDRERWGQEQRTAATAGPQTAAAQVVINLGGVDAAKSCCNLLQRAQNGVING